MPCRAAAMVTNFRSWPALTIAGLESAGPTRANTSAAGRLGVLVRPECARGTYVADPGAVANAQPTMSARTADDSTAIAATPILGAAARRDANASTSVSDAATRYSRAEVLVVGANS